MAKKSKTLPAIGNVFLRDFVDVNSSRIIKAHHDGESLLTLMFKGGRTYEYFPISKSTYEELISNESPGKYFQEKIFKKFQYFEVGPVYEKQVDV